MTTLKDTAQQYEPPQTKNVADLKEVSVNVEIETKIVNEGTNDEFAYKYFVLDGEEYRVPISVLMQLKTLLEKRPKMQTFSVNKTGTGKQTKYMVIPN